MASAMASSAALVAYLNMEAELSDLKAKRLREQADALAEEYGDANFAIFHPEEMAPVDEFGVPRYKGKKRGRKARPRKRHHNPNKPKRQHTAYTLYVHETYPSVREQYPQYQSKDIISMVARSWQSVSDTDKAVWKQRAIATSVIENATGGDEVEEEEASEEARDGEEVDDDDDDDDKDEEEEQEEEEDDEEPKKKRAKSKKK